MSGLPNKNEADINRHRNEYLDDLNLRAELDDMNLQANLVYKSTGQLPPISQMTDNRTIEQKLLDYEKMKIDIAKEISLISSSQFGFEVVQSIVRNPLNFDNKLLIFTAQRIKEIIVNLTKSYAIGIRGDKDDVEQMVTFIVKMFNDLNSFTKSTKDYLSSGPSNPINTLLGGGPIAQNFQLIQQAIIENRGMINNFEDMIDGTLQNFGVLIMHHGDSLYNNLANIIDKCDDVGRISEMIATILPPQNFLTWIQQHIQEFHSVDPNALNDITDFGRDYLLYLRTGIPQAGSIISFTEKTRKNKFDNFLEKIGDYLEFLGANNNDPLIDNVGSEIYNKKIALIDTLNTSSYDILDLLNRLLSIYFTGDFDINWIMNLHTSYEAYRYDFDNYDGSDGSSSSSSSSSSDGGPPSLIGSFGSQPNSSLSGISSVFGSQPNSILSGNSSANPLLQPVGGAPIGSVSSGIPSLLSIPSRSTSSSNPSLLSVPSGSGSANDDLSYASIYSDPSFLRDVPSPNPISNNKITKGNTVIHLNPNIDEEELSDEDSIENLMSGDSPLIFEGDRRINYNPTPSPSNPDAISYKSFQTPTSLDQVLQFSLKKPVWINQYAMRYFRPKAEEINDFPNKSSVAYRTAVNNLKADIGTYNRIYNKNLNFNESTGGISGEGIKRRGRPKGSGIMIKKPQKAYKLTVKENLNLEKGIEPTSKFIKFGKYLINNHKLHNENTLTLKHIGGGNIHCFPSKKISHNLAHVIKIITGGSLPHYNDLEKLSEPEKLYLHNVCTKSNIVDKLNIPTPNKDLYEKEIHEFEVMKGEIMSGNDNPQLIKKFKLLILKLSRNGQLPKKEVSEILEDLAHLEI
jgi:hypothetical protein